MLVYVINISNESDRSLAKCFTVSNLANSFAVQWIQNLTGCFVIVNTCSAKLISLTVLGINNIIPRHGRNKCLFCHLSQRNGFTKLHCRLMFDRLMPKKTLHESNEDGLLKPLETTTEDILAHKSETLIQIGMYSINKYMIISADVDCHFKWFVITLWNGFFLIKRRLLSQNMKQYTAKEIRNIIEEKFEEKMGVRESFILLGKLLPVNGSRVGNRCKTVGSVEIHPESGILPKADVREGQVLFDYHPETENCLLIEKKRMSCRISSLTVRYQTEEFWPNMRPMSGVAVCLPSLRVRTAEEKNIPRPSRQLMSCK